MGRKVVIAGSCLTPFGKMGGSLANIPAVQLGAVVIREALTRAGVDPKDVDMVCIGEGMGCGAAVRKLRNE